MKRKVKEFHVADSNLYYLDDASLDWLVDNGYDDVMFITPTKRLIASVEDWIEFSIDVDGARALSRSKFGLV